MAILSICFAMNVVCHGRGNEISFLARRSIPAPDISPLMGFSHSILLPICSPPSGITPKTSLSAHSPPQPCSPMHSADLCAAPSAVGPRAQHTLSITVGLKCQLECQADASSMYIYHYINLFIGYLMVVTSLCKQNYVLYEVTNFKITR